MTKFTGQIYVLHMMSGQLSTYANAEWEVIKQMAREEIEKKLKDTTSTISGFIEIIKINVFNAEEILTIWNGQLSDEKVMDSLDSLDDGLEMNWENKNASEWIQRIVAIGLGRSIEHIGDVCKDVMLSSTTLGGIKNE
ncbi:hypothetical protein QP794_23945 [Paenibacillus sp. UMB7766-LJ446]|uniref:hypothetical protein n=1 Tax=Paenibacillus sp. UMB7766-LJ446 TaxID=3046313 RepID=UPI00254F79C2|nr:hypothetical protein [Paenibacillus sp. UMB7766-LJ446]MDK8193145.1 hypothetical protein [Paenibacillus sp. UMB7766-LJ446]